MSGTQDPALADVQRGWAELRLERPLAAWASWRQALRLDPESRAAHQALELLRHAHELPAAARQIRQLRSPRDPGQRVLWDRLFRDRDLSELPAAAGAFEELVNLDEQDADAWYNLGLCRAWQGLNDIAIGALGRAVDLLASEDFEDAVDAWLLAEVLRQGAGAEHLADAFDHILILALTASEPAAQIWEKLAKLGAHLHLKEAPRASEPDRVRDRVEIAEWWDRASPGEGKRLQAEDVPRLMATLIWVPGELRASSPVQSTLEEVERVLDSPAFEGLIIHDRLSRPLPLTLADAALWSFRLPRELDSTEAQEICRAQLIAYYEGPEGWQNQPRQGLSLEGRPLSPKAAARALRMMDDDEPEASALRARLEAVVRFQEQLAHRPRTRLLAGGYSFDRLRLSLGLEPLDPRSREDGGGKKDDEREGPPLMEERASGRGESSDTEHEE
jgi:hypothetical protein